MIRRINPTVDCVFKALLGHEKRTHLLIHFLNSVLELHGDPEREIRDVFIINPYNEREFEDDKLTVVDVKAREASGRYFHIEIQLAVHPYLSERTVYAWSTLYHSQLQKGDDYSLLQPVISIWIVAGTLFPDTDACHLPFYIRNEEYGLLLNDHFAVHILQLPKWKKGKGRVTEKDRWMYLFKEGEHMDVDSPPDILKQSEIMRDAMEVLKDFSKNQKNFLLYQSRLQGEMAALTMKRALEKALKEQEIERREKEKTLREWKKERQEKEKERQEKEKALKEIEELKKLLKK